MDPRALAAEVEASLENAAEPDDVVRKALSWALREALGRDRDAVLAFLARHGEALPARVRREVGHKARTGLKAPRRGPADRPSDGS